MSDPKKPTDKAKESLERGFGELFRAAESLVGAVKREAQKTGSLGKGNVGKALDDAGREIVRAASNVATFVGSELETWGKKAQETLDNPHGEADPAHGSTPGAAPAAGSPPQGDAVAAAPSEEEWPKSREEFEKVYGPLRPGEDWPKSREEYVEQFGRPPTKRGSDPGFRIAIDDR